MTREKKTEEESGVFHRRLGKLRLLENEEKSGEIRPLR
jgi:hypothetical protein